MTVVFGGNVGVGGEGCRHSRVGTEPCQRTAPLPPHCHSDIYLDSALLHSLFIVDSLALFISNNAPYICILLPRISRQALLTMVGHGVYNYRILVARGTLFIGCAINGGEKLL